MVTKTSRFFKLLKNIVLILTLGTPPQYLGAQNYQKDTANMSSLLMSAQSKRFSDTASALFECHQALALAQKHNDNHRLYQIYHQLANIHKVNNQAKKAHVYFVAALDIVNNLPDIIKKNIYSKVGSSYMAVGNIPKAHAYYIKNFELGEATKNTEIHQISHLELGVFYKEINDYEKATQHLIKSIELSINLNNPNEICNSYRRLAAVYLRTKNYELALQNSEKSISYVDKIDNNSLPRQYVYLSYGNVLKECGQFEKAIEIFNKALNLCKEVGDKTGQIDVFISMGDGYNKMDDLDKAEFYYRQCTALIPSMGEIALMSFQNSLGSIYIKKNEYDKAIKYLNESLVLSEKFGKKQLSQHNYAQLSEAFDKKGNAVQSLFHLKKSVKLQDSIFSEENTKRLSEAQFKYNLVKSEEQVKAIQLRQGYIIGLSGLIIFLLLSGFLIYFLRTKEEKNKLLIEKNREIQDKNRQLEESNAVLLQFAHASAHDLKEPLRNINSFTNLIQRKYREHLPSEAHEYMGFITNGIKRMESLLNGLLEFSVVLSTDKTGDKKTNVLTVLNNVFHKSEDLILSKQATISYPSVCPMIFIREDHLEKVLYNILNNALKFSEIPAKVEINYVMKNGDLTLFIRDEGIGMDASYSDKIYKLFQKLNRTKDMEGVGLGLTLCKNILDRYSSKIWFESTLNEGTVFYITFPKTMISDIPVVGAPPQYLKLKNGLEYRFNIEKISNTD